jgi:hypothetical protein
MRTLLKSALLALVPTAVLAAGIAQAAAEPAAYTITIKNHRFTPAQLVVPANRKIKLVIVNEDKTPEEFESHELNREKIVTGKGKITVFVGPLKPGKYPFFGEFHMATAQGVLIAR